MNTLGFIPSWAQEIFSQQTNITLSQEHLALLLFRYRPVGVAVDLESCHVWAGLLLEECAKNTFVFIEAYDAKIRRELTEEYQRKTREHPWPEPGQDSGM